MVVPGVLVGILRNAVMDHMTEYPERGPFQVGFADHDRMLVVEPDAVLLLLLRCHSES